MAVYTNITEEQLEELLNQYSIGCPKALHKITKGIENSNFILETTLGKYILTIYEKRIDTSDLPFFLQLKQYLAQQQFPCPEPIKTTDDQLIVTVASKPAAIISFLTGKEIFQVRTIHCYEVGKALALLHQQSQGFSMQRANDFGLNRWQIMTESLACNADRLHPGLKDFLLQEMDYLQTNWPTELPTGIIHADLFPDNVFFTNNQFSGMIDFYFACNDLLAFDIAICLNAWCYEPNGEFNITKSQQLIAGYQQHRPLSSEELAALPILASGAAMRFLLTRLNDWIYPSENALVVPKDPMEYYHKLLFHKGLTKASAYGVY